MKALSRLALVVVLLVATAGVASADFTGPYVDTWVQLPSTSNPSNVTLYVQDSLSTCNDTQITYIQFDASNIATVSSASLVLFAGQTEIGLQSGPELSIYGVTDFNLATGAGAPTTAGLTPLQTINVPSTTVRFDPFTFGGSHTGLAGYIQTQANGATPQTVTLALSFSANCHGINSQLSFYSQRYSNATYHPQLTIVGTKKDPNAVSLTTFSSDGSNLNWPLYIGLGALALIAAGGLVYSRRRAAMR